MEDWEFFVFFVFFSFGEGEVFLDDRRLLSMIFASFFGIAACFLGLFCFILGESSAFPLGCGNGLDRYLYYVAFFCDLGKFLCACV
jgi:hypothetical protein